MDDAETLAKSRRGAMVAAAGCGKTQLIAAAVGNHGGGRELILTHTHAGVEALRTRLNRLGVPSKNYRVDTIAGWALRLATAFPTTAALPTLEPRTHSEYLTVYAAATRLLCLRPVQAILHASYSGVYVDEYQDCTVDQHTMVLALLALLPCRVVGDPMQGIFDFGENNPIRWDNEVEASFDPLPGPTTPWRWIDANPTLGRWLLDVRERLSAGEAVDLHGAPVQWLDGTQWPTNRKACYDAIAKDQQTTIAIHKTPNQCHSIASHLGGVYSCIEAIDTKDLYQFAERIDESESFARAVAVIDFATKCMTKVKSEFATIRRGFNNGRTPSIRKHTGVLQLLLAVADTGSVSAVGSALRMLSGIPGVVVYRRELLRETRRSAAAVASGDALTMRDAAWMVRNRARQQGRLFSRCSVGTTHLVKGLEFHHAVVLDADNYDDRNLYVALTRGSRSLTITSRSQMLSPQSRRGSTSP